MAPRDFRTRLTRRASKAGIFLPDDLSASLDRVLRAARALEPQDQPHRADDPDEAIDRLLLEPLVAARYLPGGDRAG